MLKLSGTSKKAKWSVTGKKLVTIKTTGKKRHKVLIKAGKKTGTCYLKVRVGKKKLSCKIVVKAKKKTNPEPKPQPKPEPKPQPKPEPSPFTSAYTDTSLRMLKYLSANEKDNTRNILISPDSILTAMAMTENGAAANTLAEMEAAFGNIPVDDFSTSLSQLNNRLISSKSVSYHIADSIWYKDNANDITVKDSFIQNNLKYFNAQTFKAPFSQETVDQINSWVSSNTKGMIPKIINELDEDTVMILINAIAFEGKWKDQYKDTQVSDQPFYNDDNTVQKTVKMLSGRENTYVSIGGANGFVKPYAGDEIAFLGLETPGNMTVDEFLQTLTTDDFITGYQERSREYNVKTKMPEFKYDYSETLVDTLKSLGIRDAFNDMKSDFSGISETQPLVISDVLHKTHIELDRNGTKAAAVTAVIIDKSTAIFTPKEISVNLDHPFVYAIIDVDTGVPLFIGTVKTV